MLLQLLRPDTPGQSMPESSNRVEPCLQINHREKNER